MSESKIFAWRFNLDVLLEKIVNIQQPIFIERPCSVSTCFIKGGSSDYISATDELMINEYFSEVIFVTIPSAGHWVHAERAQDFYNHVKAFLH